MSRLGAAALILVMSCVFARLPDIDQHLRALLHHRSIITHSSLPALSLLLLRDGRRGALATGALIGTAAHLGADATSPAVGYAQVWGPWPLSVSLGGFSPIWLGGNALFAFLLAIPLTERSLRIERAWALAAVGSCALAGTLVGGAGLVEGAAVAALLWASAILSKRRTLR